MRRYGADRRRRAARLSAARVGRTTERRGGSNLGCVLARSYEGPAAEVGEVADAMSEPWVVRIRGAVSGIAIRRAKASVTPMMWSEHDLSSTGTWSHRVFDSTGGTRFGRTVFVAVSRGG